MSIDAVSKTKSFCRPLCDDEIIYIMGYYPQISFSLVSKDFHEKRQEIIFRSCRRILLLYRDRSPYINKSTCMIEDYYNLSKRIGDYNYQEANRIMLCVMKNIFHSLRSSRFARKIITSTDNIKKFIRIENRVLITLFKELKKQLHLPQFESDSRFNNPNMIRSWMNDEENQECLQEIHTLELSCKKLIVIPQEIKNLKKLSDLSISYNQILDINLIAGLTELTVLGLSHNQIRDISPLTGLTALTRLYLRYNRINDISPLTRLTALTWLYLESNQISDISPLAGLTALKILSLSMNQISNINSIVRLTVLTHLDLSHNRIRNIRPIARLTNLFTLDLSNNKIKDIAPLTGLINLFRLDIKKKPNK